MGQIPQPKIVSSESDYRQQQLYRQQLRSESIRNMANAMQERQRRIQAQKQFDTMNMLNIADSIRKEQYGGNWLRYIALDPTAKGTLQALRGPEEGERLYNEYLNKIQTGDAAELQTAEQILEGAFHEALVKGRDGAQQNQPYPTGEQPAFDTTLAGYSGGNQQQQPSPGQVKTIDRNMNPNIPSVGNLPVSPYVNSRAAQTEAARPQTQRQRTDPYIPPPVAPQEYTIRRINGIPHAVVPQAYEGDVVVLDGVQYPVIRENIQPTASAEGQTVGSGTMPARGLSGSAEQAMRRDPAYANQLEASTDGVQIDVVGGSNAGIQRAQEEEQEKEEIKGDIKEIKPPFAESADYSRRGDQADMDRRDAEWRKDAALRTDDNGRVINSYNIPVAEGQEDVEVPINSDSIGMIWGDIQLDPTTKVSDTAATIRNALSANGASEEALAFLRKGTGYLRDNKGDDDAEWKEFDENAHKYFGVDGDTLFAVYNQMFDNVEKGRPLSYMPPESERQGKWWWEGKSMPIKEAVRRVISEPEPEPEAIQTVLKKASNTIDYASLSSQEVRDLDQFAQKAYNVSFSMLTPEAIAKSVGLPPGAAATVQEAYSLVNETENPNELSISLRNNPRKSRVLSRGFDRVRSSITPLAERRINDPTYIEKQKEKVENGESVGFIPILGITRDRYNQILSEFDVDEMGVSPEVRAAVPLDRRQQILAERRAKDAKELEGQRLGFEADRLEEQKRQFNENLALAKRNEPDEDALALEAENTKTRLKLEASRLALEGMKLDLQREIFEASKNGEAPPDYTLAFQASEKIFFNQMNHILDNNETTEEVNRALNKALKENKVFKASYDTMVSVVAVTSGLSVKDVQIELTKDKGFFRTLLGMDAKPTGETVTVPILGTPQVTPTVTGTETTRRVDSGSNVNDILGISGY